MIIPEAYVFVAVDQSEITRVARIGLGHFKVLLSVIQVRKSKRYVIFITIQHLGKLDKTVGVVMDCPRRSLSNT